MIDITPEQLSIIKSHLQRLAPHLAVWAFGSRINKNNGPFSDLDLALISDQPLSYHLLGQLRDEFSCSDLPFRVDLVDWHTLSQSLADEIFHHHVVIQEQGKGDVGARP
jgi:predicted nucleotidyltransferase